MDQYQETTGAINRNSCYNCHCAGSTTSPVDTASCEACAQYCRSSSMATYRNADGSTVTGGVCPGADTNPLKPCVCNGTSVAASQERTCGACITHCGTSGVRTYDGATAASCTDAGATTNATPTEEGTQEVIEFNDPLRNVTIPAMIGTAIRSLFGLAGALFLVYFIYGGFVWMTAAGGDKVKESQKILIRAAGGMVVILFSYSMISVLLAFLAQVRGS